MLQTAPALSPARTVPPPLPPCFYRPASAALLLPLCRDGRFWIICGLFLGGTLLREAVSLWTPIYFVDFVGLSGAQAASRSALSPLLSCFSVLLAGLLSDQFGARGRALTLTSAFFAPPRAFSPWHACHLTPAPGSLSLWSRSSAL